MATDERTTEERLALNQALYRSVNEQIKALNEAFYELAEVDGEWVCECANAKCTVRIAAHLSEYEAVRRSPRTFLVFPGHVYPEIERVVDENERFAIVEKLGAGAAIVEAGPLAHVREG